MKFFKTTPNEREGAILNGIQSLKSMISMNNANIETFKRLNTDLEKRLFEAEKRLIEIRSEIESQFKLK